MSPSLETVVASISIQLVITTNIAFKSSPRFFAGDATMTSALLDPIRFCTTLELSISKAIATSALRANKLERTYPQCLSN